MSCLAYIRYQGKHCYVLQQQQPTPDAINLTPDPKKESPFEPFYGELRCLFYPGPPQVYWYTLEISGGDHVFISEIDSLCRGEVVQESIN